MSRLRDVGNGFIAISLALFLLVAWLQLQTLMRSLMSASMVRVLHWLRFKTYLAWSAGTAFLILLFVGAGLALGVILFKNDAIDRRKGTPVIATITRFGMCCSKYRPELTAVYAQDSKGLVGHTSVKPNRILGCRVGDKIRAERYGIALTLRPAPCPIEIVPGEAETKGVK